MTKSFSANVGMVKIAENDEAAQKIGSDMPEEKMVRDDGLEPPTYSV